MTIDILSIGIGFMIGILIYMIIDIFRISGQLRIDTSDPKKDSYLIDISKDLATLPKKKFIILKIDNKYKKPQ